MKVFVIDLARCNGCHNCQIACKDEHCGNEWVPYALSQPDTGQFWCRVNQKEKGQIPKVRVNYTPVLCNHCDHGCCESAPECIVKRDDGLVYIDPEKARGRKDLVDLCPAGHIFWNDELQVPQKCTGCAHLVDAGEVPHCVDLCPTGALRFGEAAEFDIDFEAAGTELPAGNAPRVFYLNEPGLFVGGEVWDPKDDEVIEGALVELKADGGASWETKTDGFGDFWFEHLQTGSYRLTVQADGFAGEARDFELRESLNVGDFPLRRA